MTIYPDAEYDPTTNAPNQKAMTQWDYVCTHTLVASFAGVDSTWHASGFSGPFSHFLVRGDGFVKQTQDLDRRAAANLEGNHNVISIENADKGETFPVWTGSDVPVLTPAQITANVALIGWLCDQYNIPRTLVPNTINGNRGLAYHRQGITGNYPDQLVQGGVRWSNATGKVCPGDRRISQLKTEIIPALAEEDIDMATLADLEKRVAFLEAANVTQHNKLLALEYGGAGNPGESPIVGVRPLTGQIAVLDASGVSDAHILAVVRDALVS